ncbi:C6 zinc finger protein [Colletotrichum higginsianum IMI 349063]|uniref:C6 zinc finger protein n=1 Tax=Colletotrichum higginsianum (strain IMI 349063) TaxID=759273 RepID=A0A1B7XR41_COLHI|nr:C6 zinc finger protein [Colletotrichum higginsianum IMI 349063]OBR02226.1 C6 zinc finger protein [Colletotrichum higginsianum IMI 349063]
MFTVLKDSPGLRPRSIQDMDPGRVRGSGAKQADTCLQWPQVRETKLEFWVNSPRFSWDSPGEYEDALPSMELYGESASNDALLPVFDDAQFDVTQLLDSPSLNDALNSVLNSVEVDSGLISCSPVNGNHQESFHISTSMTHCPMPWPPDMLASPERRFLWQYFLQITKDGFLCLDDKDLFKFPGSQDPFIATIPQMAISDESLRSSIFSFAAFQYNASGNGGGFQQLAMDCSRRAAVALKAQPHSDSPWNQIWTLISLIACGIFLHHSGQGDSQDYLQSSGTLAVGFYTRPQSSPDLLSPSVQLILSMLRWTVISTVCSFQSSRTLVSDKVYRCLEMRAEEIEHNYSLSFRDWLNNPIYAFSPRLVNPLLRLARLLDIQKSQQTVSQYGSSDKVMENQMIKLEEELLMAREVDLDRCQTHAADPKELRSLNEAMHAATFLLFYVRLKGMPFTASLVRKKVQVIVSEIRNIPVASRVSHAVLFPLFIAGCEAVEDEARGIILERLRTPRGLTYNRKDVCLSLEHVWEVRDTDPGLRWPEWFYKLNPDFCINSLF